MSFFNTPDYSHRREAQERSLAARATSADIAAIHREMADRYRSLHADAAQAERRPTLTMFPAR